MKQQKFYVEPYVRYFVHPDVGVGAWVPCADIIEALHVRDNYNEWTRAISSSTTRWCITQVFYGYWSRIV